MARRTFSCVAASVVIALLCLQATADEVKAKEEEGKASPKELIFGIGGPAQKQNVLQTLKNNVGGLVSEPSNQPVIAALFLLFGFACLIDGASSFQLLVVVSVGLLTGGFMLTQLGTFGRGCSVTAAVEIGVFVALAAWLGWEGTQLLIGLGAGVYLYHLGIGAIALFHQVAQEEHLKEPQVQIHEAHNVLVVAGYTASIIVGTFLVNDKGGGQRIFAIIAPLLGAAMLASTFEFFFIFYGTTAPGKVALGTPSLTLALCPSVFDFFYMIAFPFHSRPVGYFTYIQYNFNFGGRHYELDKIIGVTLWAVLSLFGICLQCKQISKLKRVSAEEGDSLRVRLLEPAAPVV